MKIWHQSFTVLEDLPDYAAAMEKHIRKVVRPDTEVVMHGVLPGTYPSNYPGTDLAYGSLFAIHGLQWIVQALKAEDARYDAFAMCTIPNPLLKEIRSLVDMPVIGYGEASFHLACMLGHRFGLLLFIDRMTPLYQEQLRNYGVESRCAAIRPAGFTFQDVLPAFKEPERIIGRFQESARALIREGADVIIPGEMPLNVLLASAGITRVDDVPILDGLAVTLKLAEALVDLRRTVGLSHSRHGWTNASPRRERVREVLSFYGLDKLIDS
jgi:Asp/Glu/hydantoin racemase